MFPVHTKHDVHVWEYLVLDIRCVRMPDTHLYNDLSSLLYSAEEWAPVLVAAVRSGRYPMPHMTTCLPTIATDRTSISVNKPFGEEL